MRRASSGAAVAVLLLLGRGAHAQSARFADDFASYPNGRQYGEGARFGPWTVEFGGYGAVRVTDGSLELIPAQANTAAVTHSVLVSGPSFTEPIVFDVRLFTGAQLRVNDLPNPWEAAWIMWAFTDAAHSYYFLPKPNGWELAKRDPAYHGGQRIMLTGSTPVFKVNHWYTVRIVHRGATMIVSVDGAEIGRFTDLERPYSYGRVALYSEDAAVRFDDIRIY